MEPRIDFYPPLADFVGQLTAIEARLAQGRLPLPLLHLVKLRASQINGCAFCLHMHTREALSDGDAVERLTLLPAFRESPLYTERERAALAWTEAVTQTSQGGPSDAAFEALRAHFDDAEISELTLAIGMINLWNRMAIALRSVHPDTALTVPNPSQAA